MEPYSSIGEANAYFAERLHVDVWFDSSTNDRLKALKQATRSIDRLRFVGMKHTEWVVAQTSCDADALKAARDAQEREFPRGADEDVPTGIKEACCEEALSLLDGKDPEQEYEDLAVASQGYSSVRTTYERSYVLEHLNAGIASMRAWQLLRPYILEGRDIKLSRV